MTAVYKLDAIVPNALHDDPVTMAVWERDRKVGYARKRKKDAQPATEPAEPTGTTKAA